MYLRILHCMSKKYYSVQNKTKTAVDILIYGVIGESWWEESVTARRFVADLQALEKEYERINVKINSPGGSVFDGLPIFNAIKNSTAEIHTYNDGLCASMAAIILLAGKTVHSADNALMMLHSPYMGCYGTIKDMKKAIEMLEKVENSLVSCIEGRGHMAADDIRKKYFDFEDHWLTADDAKKDGLVDMIEKGSNKVDNKITSLPLDEVIAQFDSLVKGRSILDKIFSQVHNVFSFNDDSDMDIKKLREACGLPDDATEQDVLDWIKNHGQPADDPADPDPEEEPETEPEADPEEEPAGEPSNEDENAKKIADLQAQIENLKKAPGATDKKVVKQTDASKKADDQFETYSSAKETWDAVNQMFD